MSNYQSLFHVIDFHYYAASAVRVAQWPVAARCAVERSDEYLCTGGRQGLP